MSDFDGGKTNGTFTHTLRCAAIVEIVVAALRCASDSVAIAQRCAALSQRSAAYV